MQKKIAIRMIIGLIVIAAMVFGFQKFKDFAQDPDLGEFASVGFLAAIEQTEDGNRATIFDANGERINPPEPKTGAKASAKYDDREISWSGDGQRLFISSTRESNSYNVYRWNPERKVVERRSLGSRSQSTPYFLPGADKDMAQLGLMIAGGAVQELDARMGTTTQVAPPVSGPVSGSSEEGAGTISAIEAIYHKFGESFLYARYGSARDRLYAVMRNDEGEVALSQVFGADANGQLLPPQEIVRGRKVSMDVSADGRAVVAVQGFTFAPDSPIPPEFVKNGKTIKPFFNAVLMATMDDTGHCKVDPIVIVPKDQNMAFQEVMISPDGTMIAAIVGEFDKNIDFQPKSIVVFPFEPGGGTKGRNLLAGAISQPAWSPDSKNLAFVISHDGFSDIVVIDITTPGALKKITENKKFMSPKFSPQIGG